MSQILDNLRELNPEIPLYSVYAPEFAEYGRVLDLPGLGELQAAMAELPMPEEGNVYLASDESLERLDISHVLRRLVFGEMDTQSGYCNGHGGTLNALEYHRCSEINFSSTGLVLLLALPADMENDRLDSMAVRGFYLPAGTLIEIYPRVLHFAPCRIKESGFDCLVVLEKGVNEALERVDSTAPGEEKLLWMRGKWLLCHADSPQAQKGAFIGIRGENLSLKI